MDAFVVIAVSAITAIATLILISTGLAVIFGLMRVVNMAHGEFLMVGALTTTQVAALTTTEVAAMTTLQAAALKTAEVAALTTDQLAALTTNDLRAFGTAYGVAFGSFMTAGSVGVLLMGAGYDHFHSYTVTLITLAVAMLGAILLLTLLGPYRFAAEARLSEPREPIELTHPA